VSIRGLVGPYFPLNAVTLGISKPPELDPAEVRVVGGCRPGCSRPGVKLSSAGVKLSYILSLYSFDPR